MKGHNSGDQLFDEWSCAKARFIVRGFIKVMAPLMWRLISAAICLDGGWWALSKDCLDEKYD